MHKKNIQFFGIDNNKRIVEKIIKGESHLNDKKLNKKIKKLVGSKYFFVSNKPHSLEECKLFIICVSTPINEKKKEPDLSYVLSAIKAISSKIKKRGHSYP